MSFVPMRGAWEQKATPAGQLNSLGTQSGGLHVGYVGTITPSAAPIFCGK